MTDSLQNHAYLQGLFISSFSTQFSGKWKESQNNFFSLSSISFPSYSPVSSIPKNVHHFNNLVCLSALSTSSFLSYIFFFLNALILLFSFLSMFPHGLVFSHVRLYLLLCHGVHLKFFLTFLFSVVFTLSERHLCHLLNFLIFFFFLLFKASPPSPHLQSLYFTPISFSCIFKSVSFSSSPLQLSDF